MTPIENLRTRLAQVAGNIAALTAAVQAENRAMTAEENEKFKKLDEEYKSLEESIAHFERAEQIAASVSIPEPRVVQPLDAPSVAAPSIPGPTSITGGGRVAHGFENHGFKKGFGEFLLKVREARTTGRADERLFVNTVSTWGGESVGADGGYLVPPEFQRGIMSLVLAPDSFLGALRPVSTNSNMITVPTDEDAPWAATGISAAKTAEGGQITASKPVVKKLNVIMHNIKSLVSVSNESLRDIPFLSSFVTAKMASKIRWKVENYVINGEGENEPLGILNAPGLLSLSSDVDSSTTILGSRDVMAMKAAALTGAGGFWVINPTLQPQIWGLKSDTSGGFPLYVNDMRLSPDGALLGAPLFKSEACKVYNTPGDILYVLPDGYILAFEAGGVQNAVSLEFAFDQDLQSFRSTLRMGGLPTLSATVTRGDGTSTASNLIALATRS